MSALRKILVVDDDPVVGKSINRVLSEKGYDVRTALSGEEALTEINKEQYDAVFTDIRMPGMDGLELTDKIKKLQAWTPVVIITGYGTQAYEVQAQEAGVSGFLYKPLNPDDIEFSANKAVHEFDVARTPVLTVVATPEPVAEVKKEMSWFIKVALFLLSPFIGLAYMLALPFVAAGMIGKIVGKMIWSKIPKNVKKIGMILVSPFLGLGFILALPFVGAVVLGRVAVKAALKT